MHETAQKFIYKIYIVRNNNDAIWVHSSVGSAVIPFVMFPFVIVLSLILLHGIVQNFPCNILTLKDDFDVISAGRA